MTQDNRIPKVVADFAHSQDKQDVLSFLSFKDWFAAQETQNNGWTVVASSWENEQADRKSSFCTFSVLLSMNDGCLEKLLSSPNQDIQLWEFGQPSTCCFKKKINDLEFKAFTILRCFNNYIPDTFELIQEFLLYHNAFYVADKNEYHCITNDGSILPIVRIKRENENQEISVDTDYLRRYLAETQCYLVRYHEFTRWTTQDISNFLIEKGIIADEQKNLTSLQPIKKNNASLELHLTTDTLGEDYSGLSILLGKDIVFPYKKPTKHSQKKYAEFIIGCDDQGEEIEATCSKNELSNCSVDRGTPHALTPVFFKKTVLSEYYHEPSRYEIIDNTKLEFKTFPGYLAFSITTEDLVQVWLGDLEGIPYSEQLHWKKFNVAPRGTITKERFQRDFMAMPANP